MSGPKLVRQRSPPPTVPHFHSTRLTFTHLRPPFSGSPTQRSYLVRTPPTYNTRDLCTLPLFIYLFYLVSPALYSPFSLYAATRPEENRTGQKNINNTELQQFATWAQSVPATALISILNLVLHPYCTRSMSHPSAPFLSPVAVETLHAIVRRAPRSGSLICPTTWIMVTSPYCQSD